MKKNQMMVIDPKTSEGIDEATGHDIGDSNKEAIFLQASFELILIAD